jgi:prepilin-type N-terminal cleavage/methylation domain-containing protein
MPPAARRRPSRGFTLIELMIAVSIVGVLATLSVAGVTRYVKHARSTEARSGVARIGKLAVGAYERELGTTGVLSPGSSAGFQRALCASSTEVPSSLDLVRNRRYQSPADAWSSGSQHVGWPCLRFYISDSQSYQYGYEATDPTSPSATFRAYARGDLDGNGRESSFSLVGVVENGHARTAPQLLEIDPEE